MKGLVKLWPNVLITTELKQLSHHGYFSAQVANKSAAAMQCKVEQSYMGMVQSTSHSTTYLQFYTNPF